MLIFSRQLDGGLTSLVKQVNTLVKSHQAAQLQAFVTFLTDDAPSLRPKLEELARQEGLSIPLTIAVDGSKGPAAYKLDPSAKHTVLVYKGKTVGASFTLGNVSDADVKGIVEATKKLLGS